MTQCPALNSRSPDYDFITARNKHELITSTYDRSPGTVVDLSCYSGYKLVGHSKVECRADGTWDYAVKPTCVLNTDTDTTDESSDEQKIIIGVVCGVAGIILIAMLAMCLLVHCWKRKNNRDRQKDGLTDREIAMYARHQSQYNDGYQDDADRYSRDFEANQYARWRPQTHGSQLGYGMYLPPDPTMVQAQGYNPNHPYYPYMYNPYQQGYPQPWATSGSLYGSNHSKFDVPSIHGSAYDSKIWRNSRPL